MLAFKVTAPATLAMLLLLSPAAAAPEGAARETPAAQAQADDHSYLPPWMRPQAADAGATSANADPEVAAGDPAKQKAALPAQKQPQKHRGYGLFGVNLDSFNPFGR